MNKYVNDGFVRHWDPCYSSVSGCGNTGSCISELLFIMDLMHLNDVIFFRCFVTALQQLNDILEVDPPVVSQQPRVDTPSGMS